MSVELLSPAGDFETALAAFDAGADAVYCGLGEFSARAYAKNFSPDDLKKLVRVARAKGRKVYVTFNTLIEEGEIESAVEKLSLLDSIGPDAIIVQDLGVARLARKYFPGLALHASTQLVAHNLEGVLAMKELGFTRVVTARELTAREIASIAKRSGGMEFESFIHGALCYSISGLCLFSAMEKGRSGNRGECAYCCRLPYEDCEGKKSLAFSMKDLRLAEDVRKLVEAGVCSLKIEGRMKSALYVASVTRFYRQILDGSTREVTIGDLETVFSRRTTELYLNGREGVNPIDPDSLGHLGTPIGTVKRVTRDREGQAWLRFHTARALERHDGLQFASPDGGKPLGLGISMMRQAISRAPVFEVSAGTDVEILLADEKLAEAIRPGATVYCSMSNAVKRLFPPPSFRESDYPGAVEVKVRITLKPGEMAAEVLSPVNFEVKLPCSLTPAKDSGKTAEAVKTAFSKLGGTDYSLKELSLDDPGKLFAPPRLLNDLRRDMVERLDDGLDTLRRAKLDKALDDEPLADIEPKEQDGARRLKIRAGQKIPEGEWAEVIVAIDAETKEEDVKAECPIRLALPVFTLEGDFNKLRIAVKRFLRAGYDKWEASDLATLRLLKELGVEDITADWSIYAMNASAVKEAGDLGVKRLVASPEASEGTKAFLSECGFPVEFLAQQSTPLFISLTKPAAIPAPQSGFRVYNRGNLWITVKTLPRTFPVPKGAAERVDLSWSCEC